MVSYNLNRLISIVILIYRCFEGLETIEKVIILPFFNDTSDDIQDIPKSIKLEDFLVQGERNESISKELIFEQVPFDHPLVILFSSGTTGAPKCIGN